MSKSRCAILATMLLVGLVDCTTLVAQAVATTQPGTVTLDLTSFRGKLYLPVKVNGRDAGVFCIDTGSSVTAIHEHAAARLGVKSIAQKLLDTFEGPKKQGFGFVDQLEAGPFQFRDAPVFICDCHDAPLPSGQEICGTIGMDVLGHRPFAIDFRAHTLTVFDPSKFITPTDAEAMPLQAGVSTPHVDANVEGHHGWFQIDTGYGDTVLLSTAFVELHTELVVGRPQIRIRQNWSDRSSTYNMRWNSAEILGKKLPQLYGGYDADNRFGRRIAGLIGVGALRDSVLTIDWAAKKVWRRELPPEPLEACVARLRDKSHRDLSNPSPLYQSAILKRPDVAERLLQMGESPDDADIDGVTALMAAAARDQGAIMDMLLSRGAKVDATCKIDKFTPLLFAARFGGADATRRLIDAGAIVNLASESGRTALFMAAEAGELDVVNLLLDHGAKVDQPLTSGETPLLAACNNGLLRVADVLIAHDANASAAGQRGTCLSYAARHPSADCVRVLLSHDANLNLYARQGTLPLIEAASIGSVEAAECVRLLLAAGADANVKTVPEGKTAYDIAVERGHVESIKLLRPTTRPSSR